LGLIVCRTTGPSNPIIEVWKTCDSDSIWKCAAQRSDKIEHLIIESLDPSEKYFIRIADSNNEFRSFTQVKALYQDLVRASIASFSQTELTLNNIIYPNFNLQSVTFRFVPFDISSPPIEITRPYNPSGTYSLNDMGLAANQFHVSASYTLQPLNINVPFGDQTELSYSGAINVTSEVLYELYPNPVSRGSNEIFITTKENYTAQTGHISLTDISGKVLSIWKNYPLDNSTSLSLPQGLSRGLYFLKITGDTGNTYTLKIFL
jgi:hypothetical protein